MKAKQEEYSVVCGESHATMGGVMRLESVESYHSVFQPIIDLMRQSPGAFTIDVADIVFMNSSGIRALAGAVLEARERSIGLVLVFNPSVPWQKKTLGSLKAVYDKLTIRQRTE